MNNFFKKLQNGTSKGAISGGSFVIETSKYEASSGT